ncbi:MAG: DNA repair exonuclease [Candidatus Hydrogenedentes bacterium]|nr:DNA repair exonuclease [Candidatus Hydrogenedentota bacterium]
MKLIHTADIHLDASYAGATAPVGYGKRRRRRLREVFADILTRGLEWPADAILIPGDLFDHDRVSRDTVAFLSEQFIRVAPLPVFIAPGNHDPYQADSPYATERWPKNVHVFSEAAWRSVELAGLPLTVHGFAFDGPDISDNPFPELKVPRDGRIHVALGHGSERAHQPEHAQSYAAFSAAEVVQPGLHYLALGHFHAFTPITGNFTTAVCYSGAPEGHSFNELGARHYLEIEIPAPGEAGATRIAPVSLSKSVFCAQTHDCGLYSYTGELVNAILEPLRGEKADVVLRVTLTGICPPQIAEELDAVREAVANEVDAFFLIDTSQPAEEFEAVAEEPTSLGLFVRRINQEILDAPTPEQRALLVRARELGVAAYRGGNLPVRGLEGAGA